MHILKTRVKAFTDVNLPALIMSKKGQISVVNAGRQSYFPYINNIQAREVFIHVRVLTSYYKSVQEKNAFSVVFSSSEPDFLEEISR
jgi:hypothetical protein